MMPARPIVLCGPSGVGKSTILKKMMDEFDKCFGFSVSHTTRQPRPGEENGVHYHFVPRAEMEKAIDKGEFIEYALYSGNLYGTSKKAVHEVMDANRMCVLDIETQGVKQVKQSDLDPYYIFIMPPSIESLEERLRGRATETEDSLKRRLSVARAEIDYGTAEGNFDLILVNDDVDEAYNTLKAFLAKDIQKILDSS